MCVFCICGVKEKLSVDVDNSSRPQPLSHQEMISYLRKKITYSVFSSPIGEFHLNKSSHSIFIHSQTSYKYSKNPCVEKTKHGFAYDPNASFGSDPFSHINTVSNL